MEVPDSPIKVSAELREQLDEWSPPVQVRIGQLGDQLTLEARTLEKCPKGLECPMMK